MKTLTLSLLIAAFTTVIAQPALAQNRMSDVEETLKRLQHLQKRMAMGATQPFSGVDLRASNMERKGPVVQLKGNVEIKTDAMVLNADEAEYNEETREIQARGNVRVKLTAKP